jgi:DNA repair protein RadA/Sms
MQNNGLKEINNPSEILLSRSNEKISGITTAAIIQGMRPLLIEVQALVSPAVYSAPQRVATGFDAKRLNMLLAIIEKRLGIKIGNKDIFLNLAGGIKINDPALDLPVLLAVISSDYDLAIPHKYCFAGELSLAGEIKPVYRIEQRIAEAEKLGFETIFISEFSKISNKERFKIKIEKYPTISALLKKVFG